jgi:hypothetical protein
VQLFDESKSQYYAQNNATFGPGPTFGLSPFVLSVTLDHATINGRQWCTLKGLTAEAGSRIRWHVGGHVRHPCSCSSIAKLHRLALTKLQATPG